MGDVAEHNAAAAAIMGDFQKRATAMLGEFYALTRPLWTDTVQLNVWEQGSCLPPHTDNSNPDGTRHSTPWRDFSSIVYLNDDYEGGELYFTAQDRVLKPKRGDAGGVQRGLSPRARRAEGHARPPHHHAGLLHLR